MLSLLDQLLVMRTLNELDIAPDDVVDIAGAHTLVSSIVRTLENTANASKICEFCYHDVQCEREAGHVGPHSALLVF